ncbi:MAG: ribonuclease P protein component [Chthoniobacterales bacterium]|nr:ribonuclease P protein component [Chthoniobacterales bacterium]
MSACADLDFPRARRLTRPAEFVRVKRDGRTEKGRLLTLGALVVADSLRFRAGFVTSKRVGGAVVRNRIRRQLREIVRRHQGELRDGVWLVVVARPAAARVGLGALEDEWLRLATRASILAARWPD